MVQTHAEPLSSTEQQTQTHISLCIIACLTPLRRAPCCDARHPVPMMHYAGPRTHAGAWFTESFSQVTNLHHLKVLSKVRH